MSRLIQSRSDRLTASGRACLRCRRKKKRCDQQLPRCQPCEQADVECVEYDAVATRQVPRSYVRDLEDRVAHLESELQGAGEGDAETAGSASHDAQPMHCNFAPEVSPAVQDGHFPGPVQAGISNQDGNALNEHQHQARAPDEETVSLFTPRSGKDPVVSQVFLLETLKETARPRSRLNFSAAGSFAKETAPSVDKVHDLGGSHSLSLPPRETAQNLVRVYFDFANLGMPLLHQILFEDKFDTVYRLPKEINLTETHTTTSSRIAIFFVLEVFAIALVAMERREPSARWHSQRYHETALNALLAAGMPSDLEGIQIILLTAQYAYHRDSIWSVWHIVGTALRRCVELGLHRDPPADTLNFVDRDNRSKAFWLAYTMDRNMSAALSMPPTVSDGDISTEFPSGAKDEHIGIDAGYPLSEDQISRSKMLTLHLYKYRQIQSETRRALHERPLLPVESSSLQTWQQQMHARIENWHQSIPTSPAFTAAEAEIVETFELNYHTALFNLYRPSPNISDPPDAQLFPMAEAAKRMINLYRRFFHEKKLTIYWQSVHNVSSAGLALLYGYVRCREVRQATSLNEITSMVHLCFSMLWGMVERFPPLREQRDSFDAASSKVLADILEDKDTAASGSIIVQDEGRKGTSSQLEWASPSGGQSNVSLLQEYPLQSLSQQTRTPDVPPGDEQTGIGQSDDTSFLTDVNIASWMLDFQDGPTSTYPMNCL